MAMSPNVYRHREANWGPPLAREVAGGSHLALEVPLRYRDSLVALLLVRGVHGGDPTKLYFPHDVMRVGQSVDDDVARIVEDACGAEVADLTPVGLEAWTGERRHWHVCYTTIARIRKLPKAGGNVREVVRFTRDAIPRTPFAWWSKPDLRATFDAYF
jgi:hypothetical protein